MENWDKILLILVRTLKELRQCAGLEVMTQVGDRTVYRVDPAGITANLVRIDSLLKYVSEHYLEAEEAEIETVTEVYSLEQIEAVFRQSSNRTEDEIAEQMEHVKGMYASYAQNI